MGGNLPVPAPSHMQSVPEPPITLSSGKLISSISPLKCLKMEQGSCVLRILKVLSLPGEGGRVQGGSPVTLIPHEASDLALAAYEAIKASHLIAATAINLSSCSLCFQPELEGFLFLRPQENFELKRNHSQP